MSSMWFGSAPKKGRFPWEPDFTGHETSHTGGTPGQQVGRGGGAPPGSVTLAGWTPDYERLINEDPYYAQQRADLGAEQTMDLAGLRQQINRALIEYGQVPEQWGDLGFDVSSYIDPTTAQLAQQNQQSVRARAEKQHKDSVRQIRNMLASRGLLRSGALGHQMREEQGRYEGQQYDVAQQLLDYLAGRNAAYVAGERARAGQLREGAAGAGQRVRENPANQPRDPRTLPYNPATGFYGPDENGQYYDQNGQLAGYRPNQPADATTYSGGPQPGGPTGDPYLDEIMRRARDQRLSASSGGAF